MFLNLSSYKELLQSLLAPKNHNIHYSSQTISNTVEILKCALIPTPSNSPPQSIWTKGLLAAVPEHLPILPACWCVPWRITVFDMHPDPFAIPTNNRIL